MTTAFFDESVCISTHGEGSDGKPLFAACLQLSQNSSDSIYSRRSAPTLSFALLLFPGNHTIHESQYEPSCQVEGREIAPFWKETLLLRSNYHALGTHGHYINTAIQMILCQKGRGITHMHFHGCALDILEERNGGRSVEGLNALEG